MFPEAITDLLTSPLALIFLGFLVATSIGFVKFMRSRGNSHMRFAHLIQGYFAVVILMLAVGWYSDVTGTDRAWTTTVFLPYSAIAVVAVFGVPVIVLLETLHHRTIPWILIASIGISLLLTTIYFWIGGNLVSRSVIDWGSHMLVIMEFTAFAMLSFCLAARIPWRR